MTGKFLAFALGVFLVASLLDFGIFFTPLFYVLIRRGKQSHDPSGAAVDSAIVPAP